jgi:hypothetical protein
MKARLFLMLLLARFAMPLFADGPMDVSLIQLIANPKEYDGKSVRVSGVVNFEFEGDAIYLHRDDIRYSLTRNGLWLDAVGMHKAKYNGKYVLVEGTFNASSKGHMASGAAACKESPEWVFCQTGKRNQRSNNKSLDNYWPLHKTLEARSALANKAARPEM